MYSFIRSEGHRLAGALLLLLFSPVISVAQTPAAGSVPAIPAIETRAFREIVMFPQREAVATVVGRNESRISAEVSGVITRWTVDAGASVKQGEVLITLDATDARLGVARAQAALDAATGRANLLQSQLRRSRELQAQGFISAEALLQRETELTVAQTDIAANKAQLDTAQRTLSKTTIRSPFTGVVRQRSAQLGESVAPGTVLYVLVEDRAPELSAAIQPGDIKSLRSSQSIVFDAAGRSIGAKLLRVSNVVTLPGRTQEVRLAMDSSGIDLPVGSDGTLRWQDAQAHLPAQWVTQRGNTLGVFTDQGGKARFIALPGAQEGRAAPANLAPETRIVTRGLAALQDGQSLK